MANKTIEVKINEVIGKYQFKFKREALNEAYNKLEAQGHEVSILNDKYLIVDNQTFELRKKNNGLIAK